MNMLKKLPQQVLLMGCFSWLSKKGFTQGIAMNTVDCAIAYALSNVIQRKVLQKMNIRYTEKYV